MNFLKIILIGLACLSFAGCNPENQPESPVQFSGIYPHLAYYNMEGECGGGAVVPWADRLWLVTYGPHLPLGSSDKLYEITPDLKQIVRKESTGGTPANRMIHDESNQLFIGPYAIDDQRNVRVIPYSEAPGRYTGNARHLSDPGGKIYIGTMEEGLYEVDVKTLKTKMLYPDGNANNEKEDDIAVNQNVTLLPGAHGKGLYSGQGVLVYSNNGEASEEALSKFDIEAGVLAEWNGKDWKCDTSGASSWRYQDQEVYQEIKILKLIRYGHQVLILNPFWSEYAIMENGHFTGCQRRAIAMTGLMAGTQNGHESEMLVLLTVLIT